MKPMTGKEAQYNLACLKADLIGSPIEKRYLDALDLAIAALAKPEGLATCSKCRWSCAPAHDCPREQR